MTTMLGRIAFGDFVVAALYHIGEMLLCPTITMHSYHYDYQPIQSRYVRRTLPKRSCRNLQVLKYIFDS